MLFLLVCPPLSYRSDVMRSKHVASLILLAACSGSPAVNSPAPDAATSYLVRLGTDTVAMEQYNRAGNRIESTLIQRAPQTFTASSNIEMGANGLPVSWRYETRLPSGARPNNGATVSWTFRADSALSVVTRDTGVAQRRAVAGGPGIPNLGNSMLTRNLAIAYARTLGRDSVNVPTFSTNGGRDSMPIRFVTRDSVRVWYFGSPMYAKLDADGGIRWLDGGQTTNKLYGSRVTRFNVASTVANFAARDAAGSGLGAVTTRDTARATINGNAMSVDYGRPSLRGRNVWTNGVLGDTIWRTGANAATELTTQRDIRINGQTIPAGKYTLWTHVLPRNARYELIINKQTGQWGTIYNAAQDLVRVPLTERTAPSSVERFTMAIEPSGDGGVIAMQWGTKRLEVPFTVVR
jgi:hypothetical protein